MLILFGVDQGSLFPKTTQNDFIDTLGVAIANVSRDNLTLGYIHARCVEWVICTAASNIHECIKKLLVIPEKNIPEKFMVALIICPDSGAVKLNATRPPLM